MKIKLENVSSFFSNNFQQLYKPSFLSLQNVSLSLDIGSAYIKAVALEKNNQTINIVDFKCERIEKDVKDTLFKVLSNLSVKNRELATSISGQSVVLRYVNLPSMSHEELAKSMNFEIEKYIPFKKGEINFDVAILEKDKNTGKMLVLIVAAKKDLVENKIGLCRGLGYSPNFIDVCPLALANYFEFVSGVQEGICAVVNLGASFSSVDIIQDGLLVLSRDIFIGGNDFTKRISEVTNNDFKDSEVIKIEALNEDLIQSLELVFNNLLRELKVSFDFYETQSNRLIGKILITGGSAQLKGLVEFFKHSLGQDIKVISFNSDKFKLNPSLNSEDFMKNFNFYTVALGMALRGF